MDAGRKAPDHRCAFLSPGLLTETRQCTLAAGIKEVAMNYLSALARIPCCAVFACVIAAGTAFGIVHVDHGHRCFRRDA